MNIGPVTRHDEPRAVQMQIRLPANQMPSVFVTNAVLRSMYDHAVEGYPVEIGGYYLGLPLQDRELALRATFITEAVRAIATSTRAHVTMHAETFHEVEKCREKSDTILVGYYHSHPGLSVFQSGEDVYNFRTYHPENYQIAIVVDSTLTKPESLDPSKSWIGFFTWDANHNPVRLPAENLFVVDETQLPFTMIEALSTEQQANQETETVRKNGQI